MLYCYNSQEQQESKVKRAAVLYQASVKVRALFSRRGDMMRTTCREASSYARLHLVESRQCRRGVRLHYALLADCTLSACAVAAQKEG